MDVNSAPANIALIKYMGKRAGLGNQPTNASLSMTLDHLLTHVEITPGAEEDRWEPLAGYRALDLSELGRQKFIAHFKRLKTHFKIDETCVLRSANTFPSDCGLASSASSFAALTRATAALAKSLRPQLNVTDIELAALSRQGSGSSCRSFFSPWSVWDESGARAIDLGPKLAHAVIVVEDRVKTVSSSEAHRRVLTSDLFKGRPERAGRRLDQLEQSLRSGEWAQSFELCWAEFWDMHALFETSRPSFGYFSAGTVRALTRMRELWATEKDGPLVTMDAGPNVHLLLRPDQVASADRWLTDFTAITSWV